MHVRRTALALCYCAAIGVAALGWSDRRETTEPDALEIALSLHAGDGPIDQKIRALQRRVRERGPARSLELLGWAFVAKARETHDPGYYHLAEQCALALSAVDADAPAALLLRGHALHSMHRFAEAEVLARRVAKSRGLASDYGLLGDTLLDQGRWLDAAEAYQRMVDLRPDAQSLIRAAELRYVMGDARGAVDAGARAARAASPRSPTDFAWIWSRLASFQLESGDLVSAEASIATALRIAPEHAGALFGQGRILLASDRPLDAASAFFHASERDPHPEYLWSWAEALRAAGREGPADAVEQALVRNGPQRDPRAFAVYLASRTSDYERALSLAEAELTERHDAVSLDALAWALAAAGDLDAASAYSERAVASGTRLARVLYHAAAIASARGDTSETARLIELADPVAHTLLPSERTAFSRLRRARAMSHTETHKRRI